MGNIHGCRASCHDVYSRRNSISQAGFKQLDKTDLAWNLAPPNNKMVHEHNYFDIASLQLPLQLPSILSLGCSSTQLTALGEAATSLDLNNTCLQSSDDGMSSYRQERQNLVILELKSGLKYNPQAVIKYIRDSSSGEECIIVGIMSRDTLDKNEGAVSFWLDIGVDQVVCESTSSKYWLNQLIQLIRGPLRQTTLLLATKLLATALNLTTDIVQITDSQNKIIWVNEKAEKELGWFKEELRGQDLSTLHTTGGTDTLNKDSLNRAAEDWMMKRIKEGKIWEGPINSQRKTGDYIPLASKVIPVSFSTSRKMDHILYIKHSSQNMNSPQPNSRLNRHTSVRRPSIEIGPSSEVRRRSSGKSYNAAMEAPITKVINIILAAQENQPVYIAQALDKVVEILKSSGSSELFNPELLDKEKKDLVTKDLLGALLANADPETKNNQKRRSSTEKAVSFSQRPSLPTLEVTPVQIGELLATSLNWDFHIFKLEEVTERRPLLWLGMNLMSKFDVNSILQVEEGVMQNWLTLIESKYHSSNSYHNSTHAADVLQASAYFLEKSRVKGVMDSLDELILLIGAIIHDVDHPGRNSAFLCNSSSELAVLYNDTTVLENHHCALGFKLTRSHPSVNIFKNLESSTFKLVRKGLIDTVLATDMSKHFIHLNKFTTAMGVAVEEDSLSDFGSTAEEKSMIRRMLIKCADVSNPARPLPLCKEWAVRIAEEYFCQTNEEKNLGLPVVMPQFDRTTCSIPQSQIGFYDYFIISMFDAWHGFVDCPELTSIIFSNYDYWKEKLAEEHQSGTRLVFKSGSSTVSTIMSSSHSSTGPPGSHAGAVERPGRLHTVQEQGSDDQQSPGSDDLKSPGSDDQQSSGGHQSRRSSDTEQKVTTPLLDTTSSRGSDCAEVPQEPGGLADATEPAVFNS